EFPLFVIKWIRRWNERDRFGVVLRPRAPKNLRRLRRGCEAPVSLCDDPHKTREPFRIAQLFSNLMEPGLFQRHRDRSSFLFAFSQRAFSCLKIPAQDKEDRPFFLNRGLCCAMK